MADNNAKVIFNNDECEYFDYLKECRDNGEEALENYEDDDLWDLAHEDIDRDLEDVISNLDIEAPGEIILLGVEQRWDKGRGAARGLGTTNIGKAIEKMTSTIWSLGDNHVTIAVEDGKLLIKALGHDNPVNPSVFEIKALKPGVDSEDLDYKGFLDSDPIVDLVSSVYGW